MSSIGKVGMKTVKLLLSVSLQPTKLAFIDRSIDSSHAYTYTVQAILGDRSTPVLMLLQSPHLVSSWTIVTLAFSMVLPLETGLTQNSLAEQKNTPTSQMEIIPIRMQQQPFLSMDPVLKFTDSSLLN